MRLARAGAKRIPWPREFGQADTRAACPFGAGAATSGLSPADCPDTVVRGAPVRRSDRDAAMRAILG
jgi:hypothetical protein